MIRYRDAEVEHCSEGQRCRLSGMAFRVAGMHRPKRFRFLPCGCAALDRIWWLFGSQLNDLRHPMLRSVSF